VGAQAWEDVLFAHWPVPAEHLRPLVPAGLELDTFEGRAWIGVVALRIVGSRLRGGPPASAFPEINVRTYATAGGLPGVLFLSLDADSPAMVAVGRHLYGLPYLRARIAVRREGDAVDVRSRRVDRRGPDAAFEARYRPAGPVAPAAPGSFEWWLVERYRMLSAGRRGAARRAEVRHPPWPLQAAEADIAVNTLTRPFGIEPHGEPVLHLARRVEARFWLPRPAAARPRRRP
jgi:uncharacterized protein YqjF (DUF2071 family)